MATGEKDFNKIINLYDPPKDLHDGINVNDLTADQRKNLADIIKELFSPGDENPLPAGYVPIGDTKKILMDTFGFEGVNKGHYGAWIADKLNSLMILREKYTTGHEARPTGLYVSQDTGPNDVVTNPQFIITPGTVLDPAGKTKGGADYSPIANYGTLDEEYIDKLNMEDSITSIEVTKTDTNKEFTVTIETTFDGTITVKLDGNFDPKTGEANGTYFMGNPTKNEYIKDNRATLTSPATKNAVKKYLLVKELGDTLQVQWLNYMFETNAPDESRKYNRGNTVIITNDTVVFFRSLVNKVGVILTYKGKSRWYKSREEDENTKRAIEASLVKTIGDEVLRANKAVINLLEDVIAKTEVPGSWLGGTSWGDKLKESAKTYLLNLKTKLEEKNKDLSIYFSVLTTQDAARELASRTHFKAPFVWTGSPKTGYYRPVQSVTSILEDGSIKFTANAFTALSLQGKLTKPEFFQQFPLQAGGSQRGGVRRTIQQKINAAREVDGKKGDALKSAVSDLLKATIHELQEKTVYEADEEYDEIYDKITKTAAKEQSKITFVGKPGKIEDHVNWAANTEQSDTGYVVYYSKKGLNKEKFFLYHYVSTLYPEVFQYAYIVKKTQPVILTWCQWVYRFYSYEATSEEKAYWNNKYEHIPSNSSLVDVLEVNGYYNIERKYRIQEENGFRYDLNRSLKEKDVEEYAFYGTLEAIALTKYFVDQFPCINSQRLADFLSIKWGPGVLPDPPTIFNPKHLSALEMYSNTYRPQSGGDGKNNYTNYTNNTNSTKGTNLIMGIAMDIYEIYYSLAIKASYENKSVSDVELNIAIQKSLLKNFGMLTAEYRAMKASKVLPTLPTLAVTGTNARNRALITGTLRALPMVSAMGGRRAKTQKKRKAGRKTRKQHKK